MSIRQSHNFRNPIRISFLGTIFFVLLLLAYCLMGFFAGGDLSFLVLIFRWEFLVPISALLLLFLLNRWFGGLMLLDKSERALYRFVFPPLFFATYLDFLTYESAMYSAEESITSSTAFGFLLYPCIALLFLYLLISTKDDEQSPSIMLTLGIILSALSIFYASKIIFFTLLIPILLYRLNSLSWRNIFALLFGLLLVPLFVLPYLYYQQGEGLWEVCKLWLESFTSFPSLLELNPLLTITLFLSALMGQANYSFKTAQLSTKQRSYLSSFCLIMWFSFFYLVFVVHYDLFIFSLFLFTSSMLLSRAITTLDKKPFYTALIAYVILISASLFYHFNTLPL